MGLKKTHRVTCRDKHHADEVFNMVKNHYNVESMNDTVLTFVLENKEVSILKAMLELKHVFLEAL